jgi:hypothetical protein
MIAILKVFKIQVWDSPFLPFKFEPQHAAVVLGISSLAGQSSAQFYQD